MTEEKQLIMQLAQIVKHLCIHHVAGIEVSELRMMLVELNDIQEKCKTEEDKDE